MLGATYDLSATHDRATTDKIADEMTACGISGCLVRHALARDFKLLEKFVIQTIILMCMFSTHYCENYV